MQILTSIRGTGFHHPRTECLHAVMQTHNAGRRSSLAYHQAAAGQVLRADVTSMHGTEWLLIVMQAWECE